MDGSYGSCWFDETRNCTNVRRARGMSESPWLFCYFAAWGSLVAQPWNKSREVFCFLLNVAYNLKLVLYLRERCVRLRVDMRKHCQISLICRFVWITGIRRQGVATGRPWNNGGNNDAAQLSIPVSGNIMAFDHDHESILIMSIWIPDKTQCCPAKVKGIHYYSPQRCFAEAVSERLVF